jgi:hypothetical protein
MKVFVERTFTGFWPVGTAAVIVADTKQRAEELLRDALAARGLTPDQRLQLEELETAMEQAIVLRDGNY